MSTADTKTRFLQLLQEGFAARGYAYGRIPRGKPNFNRYFPFIRRTPGHLPLGTWEITVDVMTVRAGKHIVPSLYCVVRLDAILGLLSDVPYTFAFSPGGVTRGEAEVTQVDRGQDPETSVREVFEIVDSVIAPRLDRYSIYENLIEALAPAEQPTWCPISDGYGYRNPFEILSVIAAAYLINRRDLCESIARTSRAMLGKNNTPAFRACYEGLEDGLDTFFRQHLGVHEGTSGAGPEAF